MGKNINFHTDIWYYLLTALLAGANVYRTAMDQKENGHEQAAETARQEAGLKQVDSVETFVGKEKQYIVTGADKKATKCMFGCLLTKAENALQKASAGITGRQAAKAVQDEGLMSELKEVHLAREGNVLLWEVTYLNKDGQYSLSYVDFINGKIHKNITP